MRKAMASRPKTVEAASPAIKQDIGTSAAPCVRSFFKANRAAAAVIGADSRKEKRADATRVNPNKRPIVMVAPERETPENNADACATPIQTASLVSMLSSSRVAG